MTPIADLVFDLVSDDRELHERLDRLTRWDYVTGKQADKLKAMVTPNLPCLLSLSCRAKKGPVYVRIGGGESAKTFRLDARANVHPLAGLEWIGTLILHAITVIKKYYQIGEGVGPSERALGLGRVRKKLFFFLENKKLITKLYTANWRV